MVEQQILQGLVDHLNNLYPGQIRLVQLFGFRARSDARWDSDYDILVVVRDRSLVEGIGLWLTDCSSMITCWTST